jgi:hypothetical protein
MPAAATAAAGGTTEEKMLRSRLLRLTPPGSAGSKRLRRVGWPQKTRGILACCGLRRQARQEAGREPRMQPAASQGTHVAWVAASTILSPVVRHAPLLAK